jgi:hypothetical protein
MSPLKLILIQVAKAKTSTSKPPRNKVEKYMLDQYGDARAFNALGDEDLIDRILIAEGYTPANIQEGRQRYYDTMDSFVKPDGTLNCIGVSFGLH